MGCVLHIPSISLTTPQAVTHVYAVRLARNWMAWDLSHSKKTLMNQEYVEWRNVTVKKPITMALSLWMPWFVEEHESDSTQDYLKF